MRWGEGYFFLFFWEEVIKIVFTIGKLLLDLSPLITVFILCVILTKSKTIEKLLVPFGKWSAPVCVVALFGLFCFISFAKSENLVLCVSWSRAPQIFGLF